MDFEHILVKCGDFGRYQIFILILFCGINFLVSQHYFAQTMISFVPEHWCYHEKLANKSFEEIAAIYSQFENPSCTRLADIDGQNVTVSKEHCTRWIYKYDFGYRSMNTEMNWVCDSAYKARIGQSLFFIGSIAGNLLFGILSDMIGRLPVLIVAIFAGFLGDFLTVFANGITTFSICRFISGMSCNSNFNPMYIIVLEYIRPSMRTVGLNLAIGIFYCIGLVITPWMAVYVGSWKTYLLCTAVPMLFLISYYYLVQESAQWLLTRNDVNGAIKRLTRIANINRQQVYPHEFEEFRMHCEKQRAIQCSTAQKSSSFIDMFRMPRMRKQTIILLFKSIVITFCYESVSRNVEGMGISPLVMFSLSALTIFPSGLIVILFQNRIGRKGMAFGSLLFGGLVTMAAGIGLAYQQHNQNILLLIGLTIAARFGVGIAYESGIQYTTELIPTCVRGQGVAAIHVVGSAASFLTPYLLWLGTLFKAAPPLIIGSLFFIGAFLCLLLPETLNRTLPNTIAEGELFGKGEPMLDFPCLTKKQKGECPIQTT